MARLFWFLCVVAVVVAAVAGASWGIAYSSVASLLGDPPPQMGAQKTTFLWDGLTQVTGAPRVWSFSYSPTLIPGAPSVRIYVAPAGRVVQTEPPDLAARVRDLNNKRY